MQKTLVVCSIFLYSCGKSGGGNPIKSILCGDSHSRGALTVGLDLSALDLLAGDLSTKESGSNNDEIVKNTLNRALQRINIPTDKLNVANVSSIKDKDTVRFLNLGGTFAPGFGIATASFKSLANSTTELKGLFSFIQESVKVSATQFTESTLSTKEASVKQWALSQTDFAKANEILVPGSKPVVVAVIDTGVDLQHPDLKDVLVPGYNFVDNNDNPQDGNGHGTHCAGIIASQGVSGPDAPIGVASRANVKIMPIKVLGDDGSGNSQNIDKAIRWAVQNKADVISMSLGGGLEYNDVQSGGGLSNPVINDAIAAGVIVVTAAGNEACPLGGPCAGQGGFFSKKFNEYTVVPCANKGTICIGATDPSEKLAKYSNYSSQKTSANYRTKVDVNAPGTDIWSTWPTKIGGPYKAISGTSMATPYAAGVAALLRANAKPGQPVTQETVRQFFNKGNASSDDISQKSGAGRLDLYGTALYFGKEYLNRADLTPPTQSLPAKPQPTPDVPRESGGGGSGSVPTVFGLLCALAG